MSEVIPSDQNRNPPSRLSDSDDQFRAIFNAVNDGIFISNPATGRFIDVNEPGCRMFGYNKAELIGRDIETLSSGVHPYTQDMAMELFGIIRAGEPQVFEWHCKTKDGVLFWAEISIRLMEFGHSPAATAIVRDISERKRLDAQIVYIAQHDVLTGLANRFIFTTAVDQAIARSFRSGEKFAVLYLDLDHFKDVNDTLGHPIGDRLLLLVAERLQAGVRVNESVARFGGDEFAVLLGDLHDPAEIAALANRLIVDIGKPFLIDGNAIHVGASIGVAVYGVDASDAETLLSHADIALYRAKAEGRQTYRFFSDAMDEELRSRVALTEELRVAIPTGQLFLVYQPQVRAKDGRIIGVEALVCWQHPRLGVLTRESFLPIAESTGLIGALSRWVLREACRQGQQWIDAGIAPDTIAVSLSTAQLKAPLELEKMVLAVLSETRLPPHFLELEIAETAIVNLSSQQEEVMQRLRQAGVRFSLDEFGVGYSSLRYVRRFPVDRIKIAQQFISELATSDEDVSFVKSILGLSRDFGNQVIAEGVDTPEQLDLLQDWDCPEVQGLFFAPPMTAEAIVPLLSARTIDPAASRVAMLAA